MREQVPLLSPFSEGRNVNLHLSRRDETREPLFHFSRLHKSSLVSSKSSEKLKDAAPVMREQPSEKKANSSVEMKPSEKKPSTDKEITEPKGNEEADRAVKASSYPAETGSGGVVLLQWGHIKRPRCNRVDNHHTRHSTIAADESSVLIRKSKLDKLSNNSGSCTTTSTLPQRVHVRPKNDVILGQDVPHMPHGEGFSIGEHFRKRQKILRGSSIESGKTSKAYNEDHNNGNRIPVSPDWKMTSNGASNGSGGAGYEIASSKIKLDLPKILISLSRKEKEEDFLLIKGTKLPQRPKRRLKAVERGVHYCTPGTWLTDLSHSRYDVREKKCVKKRPAGLKAMESMDSDSG